MASLQLSCLKPSPLGLIYCFQPDIWCRGCLCRAVSWLLISVLPLDSVTPINFNSVLQPEDKSCFKPHIPSRSNSLGFCLEGNFDKEKIHLEEYRLWRLLLWSQTFGCFFQICVSPVQSWKPPRPLQMISKNKTIKMKT